MENNILNETKKANNPANAQKNSSKLGLKLFIILTLSLLLLIPQMLIMNLIEERSNTEMEACNEVSEKWGTERGIIGPIIFIPGDKAENNIYILPEELNIEGDITTQTLKRGIFDISVYEAPIKMTGYFSRPVELTQAQISHLKVENARLLFSINNFKGFRDYPTLLYGNEKRVFTAEQYQIGDYNALSCSINISNVLGDGKDKFEINVPIMGSNSLAFFPAGRTTNVNITSNCVTPSFSGTFLPSERTVTDEGFEATWKVLALNRETPQVVNKNAAFEDWNSDAMMFVEGQTGEASIKVDLKVPVEQYQQTTRAVKYAYLIILLTFAVVFFVEIRRQTPIHPIQYALVGLAIILFYTLLLSFSEHLTFLISYIIAAVMTIMLITVFMRSILKNNKAAMAIGGLLTMLYTFIYVIMQLESYALLVGSIGIFIILAVAMYASQKINWYQK